MHVYTPAQRDAPTNMINNAMAVGALHKLRFAQDLILYNLALSEEIDGFDGSIHKETWQRTRSGSRRASWSRRLTGIRDWAEALFATTVVFEPLVGELFRSGFVMQAAAPQGDFVTPTIMGAGESDAAREQRVARALFRMLADDEAHGAENKETSCRAGWTSYVPQAVNAPRAACSRSGRSRPRRSSASRTPSSARASASRPCSATSASRPRRRSRHDRVRLRTARSSNMAGVTLMNNQVGYVVADVMRDKDGRHGHRAAVDDPRRRRQQGRLRLRGDRRGARVGRLRQRRLRGDHVAPTTGVWSSSTIGSLLFANPEDAAEYIGFDLQPVAVGGGD